MKYKESLETMITPINSENFFHYLWGLTNELFNCKFEE